MIPHPDLETSLMALFEGELSIDVPATDSDLLDSGLVSSVTFVELVMVLEERFGIQIPLDDLELDQFRTVRRIAALVEELTAQRAAA